MSRRFTPVPPPAPLGPARRWWRRVADLIGGAVRGAGHAAAVELDLRRPGEPADGRTHLTRDRPRGLHH